MLKLTGMENLDAARITLDQLNNTCTPYAMLNRAPPILNERPASRLKVALNVRISEAAIVSCPRFEFEATAAADFCPDCPAFDGLALIGDPTEPGRSWDKTYVIRCAFPIERRTKIINVIHK